MDKVSYITSEGLKKLVAEVEYLKSVERPRISQAIAEARDKGTGLYYRTFLQQSRVKELQH